MKNLAALAVALSFALSAQEGARRVIPATAGRRLALVIGNQTYTRKPLRNALADARSMADLLRRDLDFTDVQKVEDGNLLAMQRAIRGFVRMVRPGDLALFYYSGHGMQVSGNNWMIPVDFHADFEDEVPDQAFPAQRVLKELEDAGATVRILILDACRDNPLPAAGRRSGKDGLATMNGAEGTYLLFATAENRTADDNPRGSNGLFTGYLVEAMRKPGISLDEAFKETRREVAAASGGKQRPWLSTDIDRDIVLRPGGVVLGPAPAVDAAAETWVLIKDSQDPEDFEKFALAFPRNQLARGAAIRAAQLRRHPSEVASARIPPTPTINPTITAARDGATKVNAKDGLTYVWIPPGQSTMGCSPGDSECAPDEKPPHEETITKGFWMGQTEVTQEAYRRVTSTNPSHFRGEQRPVEQVTWNEAKTYCEAIGGRLPTEAEWEYTARAGSDEARYGNLDKIAWYGGNSGGETHDVRRKQPNGLGLYDMLGNVREWVADSYDTQYRVLRGGSWDVDPGLVRASYRYWYLPVGRFKDVGLRCAWE